MDNSLPGYRFYPTEEELVSFYLHNKLENTRDDDMDRVIPTLDIYNFNPSDLPNYAGELCNGDPEQWFFFIPRQEVEARGGRPKRLTNSGYWKATGSPGYVYSCNHRMIAVRRTMVFYEGRAPSGTKTVWKMNEYKAIQGEATPSSATCALAPPKLRQEFSVCRIYKKSRSLRAFDRRPPQAVKRRALTQAHHGLDDQSTTLSPVLMQERTSSLDSSSGDHHRLHDQINRSQSQSVEALAGSSTMGVDDDHVWDWEHFDWE